MNSFFVHVYFSNETVFPDNCDDWTNENVSFGARNYESFFHGFVVQMDTLLSQLSGSNLIESTEYYCHNPMKKIHFIGLPFSLLKFTWMTNNTAISFQKTYKNPNYL